MTAPFDARWKGHRNCVVGMFIRCLQDCFHVVQRTVYESDCMFALGDFSQVNFEKLKFDMTTWLDAARECGNNDVLRIAIRHWEGRLWGV